MDKCTEEEEDEEFASTRAVGFAAGKNLKYNRFLLFNVVLQIQMSILCIVSGHLELH